MKPGETTVISSRRWSPRKKRRRKTATVMRAPPRSRNQATALTSKRRNALAWITLLCWFFSGPAGLHAAVNSATGGIGGINNGTLVGGDGTGTAQFEINSVRLALVKEARDLTGAMLPDGSDVSANQEIYFVLYVDNTTDFSAYRMSIEDAIDEAQFTYLPDSMEATTVPSGSDSATRWAGTWTPVTDALGAPDDEASVLDTGGSADPDWLTVGEVAGQANLPLTIPAQTQWAIRFRVRVE